MPMIRCFREINLSEKLGELDGGGGWVGGGLPDIQHLRSDTKDGKYKIIIIMYIYHALVNALSAHMIHMKLNMTFYTYVEQNPTKTNYIQY